MHNDHNISEEDLAKAMKSMLGDEYETCLDAIKSIVLAEDRKVSNNFVQQAMTLATVFDGRKSAIFVTLCRYFFREFLDTYASTAIALCARLDEQKRIEVRDYIISDLQNTLLEMQVSDPNRPEVLAKLRKTLGNQEYE